MSDAGFEVRITPLLRGVPGLREYANNSVSGFGIEDTTLVTQFADVEVTARINEGRTGRVTLSMHDPAVADLEAYAFAVWIAFRRPDDQPECVLFAQSNLTEDYGAGTVTCEAADPVAKAQHHYIRRGDTRAGSDNEELLLNVDKHRGRLPMHAFTIDDFLQAAHNTDEQQDREVPAFAMQAWMMGNFDTPGYDDSPPIEFERGQEVWDLVSQIARSATGPDIDSCPRTAWTWPFEIPLYSVLLCYDPPTDPEAPGESELGRNLDPADPDDPQPGEVVFDFGLGLDNVTDLQVTPGRPTTHAHVVDADAHYRETRADADSSADLGVWTDWIQTDFALPRGPDTDTSPLSELAAARVRAYGRPPKFFTLTLRPVDALPAQFGQPDWASVVGGERIGGQWYLGDYVRVRATKGHRQFSTLARIVGVVLRQEGWDGLPTIDVEMIPAVGGDPGLDPDEAT